MLGDHQIHRNHVVPLQGFCRTTRARNWCDSCLTWRHLDSWKSVVEQAQNSNRKDYERNLKHKGELFEMERTPVHGLRWRFRKGSWVLNADYVVDNGSGQKAASKQIVNDWKNAWRRHQYLESAVFGWPHPCLGNSWAFAPPYTTNSPQETHHLSGHSSRRKWLEERHEYQWSRRRRNQWLGRDRTSTSDASQQYPQRSQMERR